MPHEWTEDGDTLTLRLWPHRSLSRQGFVWFISVTAILLGLPLIALIGRAGLWVLLPFVLIALTAIWRAIILSYRRAPSEWLELSPERITLTRRDPSRPERVWSANPYWIRAVIRPGPVEDYLVLTGDHASGREVELGAFLSPDERKMLQHELSEVLATIRGEGRITRP